MDFRATLVGQLTDGQQGKPASAKLGDWKALLKEEKQIGQVNDLEPHSAMSVLLG